MTTVFILDGGYLRVVEAFETKHGYTHSEGVMADSFRYLEDAISFCEENNYKIINNIQ
jgi:hypothetical protein